MSSQTLVLVTGASGFLGSHVVDKLLQKGYRVRGSVRGAKVARYQRLYVSYGDRVEIVAIDDLAHGDFSSVLNGVAAVIHVAAPLAGREANAKAMLEATVEGALNVFRQAQKVGIKNFSLTSSATTCLDFSKPLPDPLSEKDWNPSTKEDVFEKSGDDMFVYMASKALAERAVWEFADQHPEINVTTLNPSVFIGPLAPGFILEPGNVNSLSANLLLYNILLPESKFPTPPYGYVDVRTVADGLIAGIQVNGRNRILLTGDWFSHEEAIQYLKDVRPELSDRLPTLEGTDRTKSIIDNTRAYEVLGIQVLPWKKSVLESVDTMMKAHREWTQQGIDAETLFKQSPFVY